MESTVQDVQLTHRELEEAERVVAKYQAHQCSFIPRLQALKDKLVKLEEDGSPAAMAQVGKLCELFRLVSNEYSKQTYITRPLLGDGVPIRLPKSSAQQNWLSLAENYPPAVSTSRAEMLDVTYAHGVFHTRAVMELRPLVRDSPPFYPLEISVYYTTPVEMFFVTKSFIRYAVLSTIEAYSKDPRPLLTKARELYQSMHAALLSPTEIPRSHYEFKPPHDDELRLALYYKKYLFARLAAAEASFRMLVDG